MQAYLQAKQVSRNAELPVGLAHPSQDGWLLTSFPARSAAGCEAAAADTTMHKLHCVGGVQMLLGRQAASSCITCPACAQSGQACCEAPPHVRGRQLVVAALAQVVGDGAEDRLAAGALAQVADVLCACMYWVGRSLGAEATTGSHYPLGGYAAYAASRHC